MHILLLAACSTTPPTTVAADPGTPESIADSDTSTDSGADTQTDTSPPDDTDTPWTLPSRPDVDNPGLGDSWRYGGGDGYPDVVDPTWPVVTRVSDASTLTAALTSSTAGDIVFVEDDAEIDLTGQSLCVPAGVWLAGNRGVDGAAGGLLYATAGAADAILTTCGDDVRITGLRIRGPDPETCPVEWPDSCPDDVSGDSNCAYCTDTAYGISTTYARLEVDNNELSGWTYTAVGVHDAIDADVHHNHIHHGWREGLGYGVVIYGSDPTSALIRWNRFDAMRHVVAGQGYPGEDYEARAWADLATSSSTVASLAFADLDGDTITDVVGVSSERMRVSWGGRTSWETLRYEGASLDDLRLGDFDGDGRADVLRGGCL